MAVVKRFSLASGLFAALLFFAPKAQARPVHDLGLGIMLGQPSGLSAKLWLDDVHAVDLGIGSLGYYVGAPYNGINIHADYLWHYYGVFGGMGSDAYRHMPLYIGVGALFTDPGVAGVRVPFGITYLFARPFDLFLEIAPTLVLAPGVGMGTDAALGGRFYF